jgi:threonine synthase
MKTLSLVSTLTGIRYPFNRIEEFAANGEALEVEIPDIASAKIQPGSQLWQRFAAFLPFNDLGEGISLGEGNTPLLEAGSRLREYTGIRHLLLKNEMQNPTWSFKDRGSITCIRMAQAMQERVTATISTGNMGHSLAAYGAHASLRVLVFVPPFATQEKIASIAVHGATVIRVRAEEYSVMKRHVLDLAADLGVRIVSGNGPLRVEGYKLTAFELFEQLRGHVPEYIAVPTSACGHIRGLFKGFHELHRAGLCDRLPRMIIVQAANNSPIVSAIKRGEKHVIPFTNVHTIAEAITTGNPPGGDELIDKAGRFGWLAEDASEDDILEGQRLLAADGYFVEPAAATSLAAVRKLRAAGKIALEATVVLVLTGSGLKDMSVLEKTSPPPVDTTTEKLRGTVTEILRAHDGGSVRTS